jgi:hypothetical protein
MLLATTNVVTAGNWHDWHVQNMREAYLLIA